MYKCTISWFILYTRKHFYNGEWGSKKALEKSLHGLWTPPSYFLRKKMGKSLYKKKLYSYFSPRPDSNPQTLQNLIVVWSGALHLSATTSYTNSSDYTWLWFINSLLGKYKTVWGKKGQGLRSTLLTCNCSTIYGQQHVFHLFPLS